MVGVFWPDLKNVCTVLARILFFLCPVLYSIERIPEAYRPIYMLNPLADIYHMFRRVMLQGLWPETNYFLYTTVFVLIYFFISLKVCNRLQGKIGKYW